MVVPLDIAPMEAKLVTHLPGGQGWQYEPKWDGFRCIAFRAGEDVELRAKSGKALTRYFPELVAALKSAKARQFVLDGELAISVDGQLSFDALQMRLHPAESRIRKLSQQNPARLIAFDVLALPRRERLFEKPFAVRRACLEQHLEDSEAWPGVEITFATRSADVARGWLERADVSLDGVVAKRLDLAYQPGERAMLKVKCLRTADCVVGGFRYAQGEKQVGSLLLGLYDEMGLLHHVGFTSAIGEAERAGLTKKLESLIAAPGFTGSAPGGPSRWSNARSSDWQPVRPQLVVEVRYDKVTANRFRHGTQLVRWRPDKAPRQCDFTQLKPAAALSP